MNTGKTEENRSRGRQKNTILDNLGKSTAERLQDTCDCGNGGSWSRTPAVDTTEKEVAMIVYVYNRHDGERDDNNRVRLQQTWLKKGWP